MAAAVLRIVISFEYIDSIDTTAALTSCGGCSTEDIFYLIGVDS